MNLEVVIVPVSDVDRARQFYKRLGFREDIDVGGNGYRALQMTPPRSAYSIIFGKGCTSARSGSIRHRFRRSECSAARGGGYGEAHEAGAILHD
jgi:catechol 2,3-dioxygenase-like lactoylglutathione lyase family enzyme